MTRRLKVGSCVRLSRPHSDMERTLVGRVFRVTRIQKDPSQHTIVASDIGETRGGWWLNRKSVDPIRCPRKW
jgi:hypothetical protein